MIQMTPKLRASLETFLRTCGADAVVATKLVDGGFYNKRRDAEYFVGEYVEVGNFKFSQDLARDFAHSFGTKITFDNSDPEFHRWAVGLRGKRSGVFTIRVKPTGAMSVDLMHFTGLN